MITPRRLIPGITLTASLVTLYTVPSTSTSATTKQLIVCNTDVVARSFTYHVVPGAGTAGVPTTMFSGVVLQAGESKVFGLTDVMPVGYFIQAKADVTAVVSLTVSGMENT